MRLLYSLLMYLLTPLVLLHLCFKGIRSPAYLRRWGERFARFKTSPERGGIVVHAVSVGEVNAASPLIKSLLQQYPDLPLTLTTFTPTGSDRVKALFGDQVFHVYVPLDLPGTVKRFFDRIKPRLVVIMETEIWPNLYTEAYSRDIPVMIANARMSDRSVKGYTRFKHLTGDALSRVSYVGAQSEQDASRLLSCGAKPETVEVTGNLKFDVQLQPSLLEQGQAIRQHWGEERPVLLAGSTHEGDEAPVLEAFLKVLNDFPQALLVTVPRHPERFAKVAQEARSAGLRTTLRSQSEFCDPDTQCFVIDTMGELMRYCAAVDVAFIGGSFAPIGGHNVLEPAALGKPVLVGPHTFNFKEITERLIASGGARQVADQQGLAKEVITLFKQPGLAREMGEQGRALVDSGRGALSLSLEAVKRLLVD